MSHRFRFLSMLRRRGQHLEEEREKREEKGGEVTIKSR
jgi:hypothetical protein